jgi:RimJ/RimL family protein N-acetyltransferase
VPFDSQPILRGDLLVLRPLRAEDYDALCAAASDPLIWEQHPDQTRFQPDGFRVFFRDALASGGALIAIDASTGAVIGSSRFHGYNEQDDEVEIGWTFLVRTHWGGRYNGEMKRLMLAHAFRFVSRVVFLVGAQNVRSQKAVERIGGRCIGTRRDPSSGRENLVFAIASKPHAS